MARRFLGGLRLRPPTETKQLTVSPSLGMSSRTGSRTVFGARDRSSGWDLETVVDGYERAVWVFNCVEAIAGNASRLPFTISNDDTKTETHPLLRVMNGQANPMETGRQFRKRLSMQVLLSKKGAFVEVTRSRGGSIVRLDLLDPSRTNIIPDDHDEYISYYEHTRPDGEVVELDPSKIRWVREPHPTDPYSGTTPLEAAGMSIQLDQLARLYNISFISRDGRPGGILGIDTTKVDPTELERIARKLRAGPEFAGEIAAIGTGAGGISYIDTSAKPRDMAYETTSEKARREILAAFKVPESKAGDASGRTYDNAEQEDYNFWNDPMLPHMDTIASAFHGDVDPDLWCGHDTSKVEALELPARKRREERRQEWNAGLITIKEYRADANYDLIDNAHTRALWISPTKAPVPGDPGDAAALGITDEAGAPGAPGDGGDAGGAPAGPATPDGGQPPAQDATTLVDGLLAAGDHGELSGDGVTETAQASSAADAVTAARAPSAGAEDDDAASVVAAARMEGKVLLSPRGDGSFEVKDLQRTDTTPADPDGSYEVPEDDLRRTEMAVSAAMTAMLARQAGVIAARVGAPKTRQGTAYWAADGEDDPKAGTDPIDTEKVVDIARWEAETQETLAPLLQPAATESASSLLGALATAGVLIAPPVAGAVVAGQAAQASTATAEAIAKAASQAAVAPVMLALVTAQQAMRTWLEERIVAIDAYMVSHAPVLSELQDHIAAEWTEHSKPLADGLAVTTAQTAVLGSSEAAAGDLNSATQTTGSDAPNAKLDRLWVTRNDERVRASHREAAGQLRAVGEPFIVGGHECRYPSDPLAPPAVSRNCRCWLTYTWPPTARFTL